jgi:hypothetical protein
MAVKDTKIDKDAKVAIETLTIPIITALTQADVIAFKFVPGHSFEIVGVQAYARTVAGAVTLRAKISGVTAMLADITPTTGNIVAGTLAAALAARRGSKTDSIDANFTTDGSGVLTNGFLIIQYRPVPLNGEIFTE